MRSSDKFKKQVRMVSRKIRKLKADLADARTALLTPKQKQALAIVQANPGIRPKRFAELMWPKSDCWERRYRCGNGSHKGGGMYQAGGGYLGRLRKLGLVHLEGPMDAESYYVSKRV